MLGPSPHPRFQALPVKGSVVLPPASQGKHYAAISTPPAGRSIHRNRTPFLSEVQSLDEARQYHAGAR